MLSSEATEVFSERQVTGVPVSLVDEMRFRTLCEAGDIRHVGCQFLSSAKIGLSVADQVLRAPAALEKLTESTADWAQLDLRTAVLERGAFYLAQTIERISISSRIMGFLHTRSQWARVGLDCLGTSTFVAPEFGQGQPKPFVLELRPLVSLRLPRNSVLAGLVLFELDKPPSSAREITAETINLEQSHAKPH